MNVSLHFYKYRIREEILSKNITQITDKNEVLLMISVLLQLIDNFTNLKNNNAFVKLQGFLTLNQNLFIGDTEGGEEIWIYLVTYGRSEYIPYLKDKIKMLNDERERVRLGLDNSM